MQRSIFVLCLRRVPFFRQALFIRNVSPTAYVPISVFFFMPPAAKNIM